MSGTGRGTLEALSHSHHPGAQDIRRADEALGSKDTGTAALDEDETHDYRTSAKELMNAPFKESTRTGSSTDSSTGSSTGSSARAGSSEMSASGSSLDPSRIGSYMEWGPQGSSSLPSIAKGATSRPEPNQGQAEREKAGRDRADEYRAFKKRMEAWQEDAVAAGEALGLESKEGSGAGQTGHLGERN